MQQIDTRGRSCPEPVMLTRAALKKDAQGVCVLADNLCAAENITRFANHSGYEVKREENGGEYTLLLQKK
ncbi:MAG: sulfurtransferase TusA family protein [Clostridia bacterium]